MEKFFISRPIFAISLAIVIVLVGLISILNLPIEQYPDITPPVVEVSATYDGADAETVNNAVATPVAQSVMGVSDMLYLQTTSANDGSMVMQVTFDIGSDPDLDAIFTQNNVSSATAELPATVTRQGVTTRKTMTGFLMVYSLHSDGRYDGEFLSNYAYINLQNELLKIDGVGKVSIMGAGEYAMRVWLRPDVLKYYGITVGEVTAAIEKQGGIYPAGQFGAEPAPDGVAYTYTVTMPPQISTAAEFADIVVVAVKPYQVEAVLAPVRELLAKKIVVSVAAGVTFDDCERMLAPGTHHLSIVPNTPVSVCEGIIVCERRHSLSDGEWRQVEALFSKIGLVLPMDTALLGISSAVCGCGPAFVAMFIEALGDAAVKHGVARADAYRMASQMIVGTGKLQLSLIHISEPTRP